MEAVSIPFLMYSPPQTDLSTQLFLLSNSFPKISIKMWADELKKPDTQEITKTCLAKIILLLLLLFL